MIIKQVTMGLERTVRHKPYVISTPILSLVGEFEPGEVFGRAVDSLHDEVLAIMKDMVTEEQRLFTEEQDEIKNQRRELKTRKNSKHQPATGSDVPF